MTRWFVKEKKEKVAKRRAIEVKSERNRRTLGLAVFLVKMPINHCLLLCYNLCFLFDFFVMPHSLAS